MIAFIEKRMQRSKDRETEYKEKTTARERYAERVDPHIQAQMLDKLDSRKPHDIKVIVHENDDIEYIKVDYGSDDSDVSA